MGGVTCYRYVYHGYVGYGTSYSLGHASYAEDGVDGYRTIRFTSESGIPCNGRVKCYVFGVGAVWFLGRLYRV